MLVRPISVLNLSLGSRFSVLGSRFSVLGSRLSGLGLRAPGLEGRRAAEGLCDVGHLRLERSAKGNKIGSSSVTRWTPTGGKLIVLTSAVEGSILIGFGGDRTGVRRSPKTGQSVDSIQLRLSSRVLNNLARMALSGS